MAEPRAVVHNFAESVKFSTNLNGEVDWLTLYRGLWPDMIGAITLNGASEWNRRGVDRKIFLPGGREITVDEKIRPPRKDGAVYDDFLIEEWSDLRRQKIGWTLDPDKWCDFVAYAILSVNKCYLLPFELLRLACVANLSPLKEDLGRRGRKPIDVPNETNGRGWITRNWPVHWVVLFRWVEREIERRFGGQPATRALPVPKTQGQTLLFDWAARANADPEEDEEVPF